MAISKSKVSRNRDKPGEKVGDKREQILQAAATVFAAKGFFGARVSDIADKAKVADGTIYLYLDRKSVV